MGGCARKVQENGCVLLTDNATSGATVVERPARAVEFDTFLQDYTATKENVEKYEGWPDNRPSTNKQYLDAIAKAQVLTCLSMVGRIAPQPKVRMQQKPMRAVFADANYAAGKLVLVPETTRVTVAAPGSSVPHGCHVCSIDAEDEDRRMSASTVYLTQMTNKDFAVPAWALRTTDDEEEATMVVTRRKVKTTFTCEKPRETTTVEIPVMTNSSAVTAGDELVLFAKPPPKQKVLKRDVALLNPTQPAKKAKRDTPSA